MSLNDLILEVMKQLNGNTTGSMNANITDTIDLFIESLNSDSLYDKAERILDAEQGDVGMTSLNAKLQYWLIQRVPYAQGDSLEDLLYRYLLNLYNVNNTALAHYVNFTDDKWHDIINDYDADLVNSNAFQSNGTDNYVDTGVVPVDSADWYWESEGRFDTLVSQAQGALVTSPSIQRFYFGVNAGTGNWVVGYKTTETVTTISADTNYHKFKLTGNGLFYVDDILVYDASGNSGTLDDINEITLFARNYVPSPDYCDYIVNYSKNVSNSTIIKEIVASAGIGDQLYDTDGNEYQIEGTINEGTQWVEQDVYHYNLLNGFDMYTNTSGDFLRVPIGSTVSQTGYAYFDTFTAGANYLPAETEFALPDIQALKDADDGQFYTGGIANELDFYDIANARAEQEVIGIESTVGTDGQAQAVVNGLSVAYQVYTADVANLGTVDFESILNDNYFDTLHGTILVGTGSTMTITNDTGATADVGVIHMTGQIENATASEMTQIASTMLGNTDLQHSKNPILQAIAKNRIPDRLTASGLISENWYNPITLVSASAFTNGYPIKITPGVLHYLQGVKNKGAGIQILNADASDIISGLNETETWATDTTVYLRIKTDINGEFDYENLMFSEGDATTAYEPFKSSKMSIRGTGGVDWIGRSNATTQDIAYPYFGKAVRNISAIDNTTLATPIVEDIEVTYLNENGDPQDYLHLYENGQISGEAEELLPIVKYQNLQNGENVFARTYPQKSNLLIYATPISGLNQNYGLDFVGRPELERFRLLDSLGDYLFDSNNDALYVGGI